MATPGDIVDATQILAQESETAMAGADSNRVVETTVGGNIGSLDTDVGNGGNVVGSLDDGVVRSENIEGRGYGENVEHEFSVGDFVWAKIKNHPWWPGQIYDPKDASDFAVKYSQENHLLVAFFGDGSSSWCLPSQLVPFAENFKEMSMDSDSKSFQSAVEKATDAIGRLVESRMACNCIPLEKREALARPVVSNAGVKAGVLMPEVDFDRLSIPKCEPDEMIKKLKNFAKNVSVDNVFELAVLRSHISSFYRSKGVDQLPVYEKPIHIEGLEDNNKNTSTSVANDVGVSVEVPKMGLLDDEPAVSTGKSPGSAEDKVYRRRKEKSVAELMQETKDLKPEKLKRTKVNDEPDVEKSLSPLKRKKSTDKEAEECDSNENSSTSKKILIAKNNEAGKSKNIEVASSEGMEESQIVISPRERKKSKYLSPPYTNPVWRIGSSTINVEPKSDRSTKNDTTEIPPVSKRVDNASTEKSSDDHLEMLDIINNDKKLTFSLSDVDVPVNEVLAEVQFAALHPRQLREEGSLNMVRSFSAALRSSTCIDGPNYEVYKQHETGMKEKALASQETELKGKGELMEHKSSKAGKNKRKSDRAQLKAAVAIFRARIETEDTEGNTISSSREEPQSSQPTDDIMKDVKKTRNKLKIMKTILKKYLTKFSVEDKATLKDEMKRLMDDVESVCEKVRVMAENSAL